MRRPGVLVAALVVAGLVAAVAAPTVRYGFVYDDEALVLKRPPFWELGLRSFLASRPVGTGRHMTAVSLDLDRLESGTASAAAFHRTNILLGAGLAVLVFTLAMRIGCSPAAAFLGASVFAVHPVHVDAVAWITGRSELLAAIGVLAAMLLAIRPAPATKPGTGTGFENPYLSRVSVLAGTAALATFAIFSKENALCLPLLVVLARWTLGRRVAWAPALAGTGLAVAAWALWIGPLLPTFAKPVFADNPLVYAPLFERIPKALAILWQYAALLVWPHPLLPDRSYATTDPSLATGWLGAAAWIVAAGLAWRLRERAPRAVFALGWFPVSFAVTANVASAIGTIMSERLLLLPSVSLSLVVAIGYDHFATTAARRRAAFALTAVACAVMFVLFRDRAAVWENPDVYFAASVAASPRSAKAQYDHGGWLLRKGDRHGAEAAFGRALEIVPSLSRAAQHKAESMARRGDPGGGADVYIAYLRTTPGDAGALTNVTRLLLDAGRAEEAVRWAQRRVELAPDDPRSVAALVLAESVLERARAHNAEPQAAAPEAPAVSP